MMGNDEIKWAPMNQAIIKEPWPKITMPTTLVKDIYYCPLEIIKGLTDKGQFQYATKLKGPQEGTYLYSIQFLH